MKNNCEHQYSRSLAQPYPRHCTLCGKPEYTEVTASSYTPTIKTSGFVSYQLDRIHDLTHKNNQLIKENEELKKELEKIKHLAHEGLPDDCVKGWDEVKFCANRQGDGNACKHCSNYR
jgi:hypothetical protein